MKLLLLFFVINTSIIASAQYKTVQLCNESYKLNGGTRAIFGGGISRNGVYLRVPPGTVHLLYTISVSDNEGSANPVGLLSQVTSLLTGYSSIAAIGESVSGGSHKGVLNVYYHNNVNCASAFINKSEQQCNTLGGKINFTGGTVDLDWQPDKAYENFYLCFMNPSSLEAVFFNIEAVAIVKD
jgi:hypothetical protein